MQQLRFLFAMALLYMFRVTISPIIGSTMLYMATGELAHCKLTLGVLVLVSKFRPLGVDEFNICGSVHHAL